MDDAFSLALVFLGPVHCMTCHDPHCYSFMISTRDFCPCAQEFSLLDPYRLARCVPISRYTVQPLISTEITRFPFTRDRSPTKEAVPARSEPDFVKRHETWNLEQSLASWLSLTHYITKTIERLLRPIPGNCTPVVSTEKR